MSLKSATDVSFVWVLLWNKNNIILKTLSFKWKEFFEFNLANFWIMAANGAYHFSNK